MSSIPLNKKKHSLFWTVKSNLIYAYDREPTILELKQLVDKIHAEYMIPVNRDIKRSKDLLICWLCDNWLIAQRYLPTVLNADTNNPKQIIRFSKCSSEKKKKLMEEYILRDKMIEIEDILKNAFNKNKLTMDQLKSISDVVCKKTNLKLNRNEKRDKFANIAWFTRNWEIIKPIIDNNFMDIILNNEDEIQIKKDIMDETSLLFQLEDCSENENDDDFFTNFLTTNY